MRINFGKLVFTVLLLFGCLGLFVYFRNVFSTVGYDDPVLSAKIAGQLPEALIYIAAAAVVGLLSKIAEILSRDTEQD